MISLDEFKLLVKETSKAGRPHVYNPDKHINLLCEVFYTGGTVEEFCYLVPIHRSVFYDWLKKYKEFNSAYKLVLLASMAHWQRLAKEGNVNPAIYLHVMKTRFNRVDSDVKLLSLKELLRCKTFGEMQRVIIDKVARNELTAEEGNELMDLVGKAIRTEDVAELARKYIELEAKTKSR